MDVAAFIITILATAAAIVSVIVAILAERRARRSERDASAAADRAVKASEQAAAANATIATIQTAIFNGPPWHLDWHAGDTYILTNTSPIAAHEVTLVTEPEGLAFDLDDTFENGSITIGPRSAILFLYGRHFGMSLQQNLIVSWRRADNDQTLSWSHPIPHKPSGA